MTATIRCLLVAAAASAASATGATTILIDFGNDSSFRGASVASPDGNGNHWTSVWSGAFYPDLVDKSGVPTAIDFGFDGSLVTGTDYFNGPSGATADPTASVYNAAALGDLGVDEAVYDYYVSSRFQIQQLDLAKTYDLEFFGSHKFNNDNTTRYTVYTDGSFTTPVASVDLLVGVNADHNQEMTASLTGLSPAPDGILYVEFVGANGGSGYLNAMSVTEVIPEPSATLLALVCLTAAGRGRVC